MQELGFQLNILQLKLKVSIMTQGRNTSFTNGIPSPSWLHWFRQRHLELSVRLAQGLDAKYACSLYVENVKSFYKNLSCLYAKYEHSSSRIWNCDKSGIKEGWCNGGTYVFAELGLVTCTRLFQTNRSG
jgi:hypothetical protein